MTAPAKKAQRTLDRAVAIQAAPVTGKGSRRRPTDIERAAKKLWHLQAVCELELSDIRYLEVTPEVRAALAVLLREVQGEIEKRIGELAP